MTEKTDVSYRLEWTDTALDNQKFRGVLDHPNLPQRVAEAFAQGLRDFGDFSDVTLTRIEHHEKDLCF